MRTYSVHHMMLTSLLILWAIVASTASTSHPGTRKYSFYSLKEHHVSPKDWIRGERAPRQHQLSLHIGLAQENFKELEKKLEEISTPGHPRFRLHLTAQAVRALVQPSNKTIDAVKEWLEGYEVPVELLEFSPSRDWIITPKLPISLVEKLLHTSYHVYRKQNVTIVRTEDWSLPLHLHGLIDIVQPTTSFSQMRPLSILSQSRQVQSSTQPSLNDAAEDIADGVDILHKIDLSNPPVDMTPKTACNTSAVTPICLRTLYGTLNYTAQAAEKNSMALTNYWGEFNNRSDIKRYLHLYRPEAAEAANDFTIYDIGGAVNQQTPATASQLERGQGREGNLDAQVMLGVGSPTRLVTYSVGGEPPPYQPDVSLPDNTNEPFLTWLQYILAQTELPTVVSTSYADTEYTVPPSYAKWVCNSFAQLGARGVTVVFGSGDWGVGDPKQCHSPAGNPRFVARFPESCPYGTSVGATRNINPEIVAYNDRNGFVSGGGFSEYFARPAYQDHAVNSYISRLEGLHDGLYNSHGRAYPDVAAMGYRIVTVWNGTTKVVDGTSASAPIFAAVVALVNDALIAEGKPPLGFLNPWLYSGGFRAFTDVTLGSTRGCNTSGFPAMSGWDAASGFGTPWFPMFRSLASQNRFRQTYPWYID
ncbi:Pro-kumamolisin [Xylaria bambusicola]|uniref:Pro-kumamolisin n=1 Tax=Xylaria bambusicola TaxID=326684 RepID=UPI00200749F9|nr:Pro-kumamolisin [Xylaria bambusicola]KAI0505385.1 Pro-kumamolisin [Xylaria bambusicola]